MVTLSIFCFDFLSEEVVSDPDIIGEPEKTTFLDNSEFVHKIPPIVIDNTIKKGIMKLNKLFLRERFLANKKNNIDSVITPKKETGTQELYRESVNESLSIPLYFNFKNRFVIV